MKRLLLITSVLAVILSTATVLHAKEITVRGKLQKTVEAGGWLIVKDDTKYLILNPKNFESNDWFKVGTNVEATGEVKEVMTNDLPMVDTTDTVEHCMNLMISHKARYLLAYNDQQFAGVITIHDLLRQVISNKEAVFDNSMAEQLLNYDEGRKIY